MSAEMVDHEQQQWGGLEPEGPGHEALILWGQHRRGGDRVRSPVTSGNWSEPLDPVHEDEPPIVVQIDRLFAKLWRGECRHSVQIAKIFYLEHPRYDFWEIASKLRRTEGFVRLTIRGICGLVEYELRL